MKLPYSEHRGCGAHEKRAFGLLGKVLLTLTLMSLSLPSLAQRRSASEQAEVNVTERKRAKTGGAATRGRPVSRAEIFAIEVRKQIIRTIDSTLRSLRRSAARMKKGSDTRLEVLYRAMNLHQEQATYVSAEEYRRYDRLWERWNARGRKGREPKLVEKKSVGHWKSVLRVSTAISKEFPKGRYADRVLFTKALALTFLRREKEAAKTYTLIIKRYPNSDVAGDSYFSLGDYYFDRNDFRNAISNYKSALRYRRSKRYGWALFKLGWCYYNLSRYETAVRHWKKTVRYSRKAPRSFAKRLREEALRDMVYGFAELKKVEEAIAYYRANGGMKYIGDFLTLLAQLFIEQGNFPEAIKVYKRFQQVVPTDPRAPEAQKEIAGLLYEERKFKALWRELNVLAEKYDRKSRWARANAKDRKLVLETELMIKDQILYYAKILHKNAQKSESRATFREALTGYKLFLRLFPKAKEEAEAKFNMADIEYVFKRYRVSGGLYLDIALMGKKKALVYDAKNPKRAKNIHRDSARFMLDAYLKDFEPQLKVMLKRKPNFSKPPRPLTRKARNFLRGCSYYVKWYPKDQKNVKNCDVFVAEVYYRNNDRKNALKFLWLIAAKYPKSKEGPEAAENLIPLYSKDRKGLLTAVNRLLRIPEYQRGKLGKKLRDLQRRTRIDDIKSEKDAVKRAKRFFAESRRNAKAEDADALMYNAAVDFEKGGALAEAIGAYRIIVTQYPKFAQAKDSMLRIARLFDLQWNLPAAADAYVSFTSRYGKAPEAPGSLARACEIQIALHSPKALRTCRSFVNETGGGQDLIERLIVSLDRQKRYVEMSRVIRGFYYTKFKLGPTQVINAEYRIFKGAGGSGSTANQAAKRILSNLNNASQVKGEALRHLGEVAYRQVEGLLDDFLKIKLKGGTVDGLLASIQGKTEALQRLQGAYRRVLQTGDSYWGVAALNQIGEALEDMANQLSNPPSIQGASLADVKQQLAPQAKQLLGQASGVYKEATGVATKFQVYSSWAVKVRNGVLRTGGSGRSFSEWIQTPDFVGSIIPSAVIGRVRVDS